MPGTKPAPIPWIGCGPGLPPDSTGDSVGSTAKTFRSGQDCFSACAQPVMCPPVPTPVIIASSPSGKSSRISFAVVSRWIFTLAGFSNCCGIQAPGVSARSSFARAMAPDMPFSRGVRSKRAP